MAKKSNNSLLNMDMLDMFQQLNFNIQDTNNFLNSSLSNMLTDLSSKVSPMKVSSMKVNLDNAKFIDEDTTDILENIKNSTEELSDSVTKPKPIELGMDDPDEPIDSRYHATDALKEIADQFTDDSSTLGYKIVSAIGGLISGFSFSQFIDSTVDFLDEVNQSYQNIAHQLQMTPEEIKSLRRDISGIYREQLSEYKGYINQEDVLQSYQDVVKTFNLTNTKSTQELSASLTAFKSATGEDISADQIQSIYDILKANNLETSLATDTFNDMVKLSRRYGASYDDMLSSISSIDNLLVQNSVDDKSYRKNMYSALKASAITKSNGLDIDQKIFDDFTEAFSNTFNTSDQKKYLMLGLDYGSTMEKVRSGDIGGAQADLMSAIKNLYENNKDNRVYLDQMVNLTGISINQMAKIAQMSNEDLEKMRSIDKDIDNSSNDELERSITGVGKVSKLDQMKNELSFSQPYNDLSEAVDTMNHSTLGSTAMDIGKTAVSYAIGNKVMGALSGKLIGSVAEKTAESTASKIAFPSLKSLIPKGVSNLASGASSATTGLGTTLATTAGKYVPGATAIYYGATKGVSAISNYSKGNAKSGTEDVGSGLGGIGGALAGAKAGALAGTFAGPIGSAIGGAIGALGGGLVSSKAGKWLGGKFSDLFGIEDKNSDNNKIMDAEIINNPSIDSSQLKELTNSGFFDKVASMADLFITLFGKNPYLFDTPLGIFSKLNEVGFINLLKEGNKVGGISEGGMYDSDMGFDDYGISGDLLSVAQNSPSWDAMGQATKMQLESIIKQSAPNDRQHQEFLMKVLPGAIDSYKKYGVFPSVTLGQAVLESDWGKSSLTSVHNNAFGIKAGSDWKGRVAHVPTFEYDSSGRRYNITGKFREYNSLSDSVVDHGKFLAENRRYAENGVFSASNGFEQLKAIQRAGYATDPQYANKVSKAGNGHFAKIDQLLVNLANSKSSTPTTQVVQNSSDNSRDTMMSVMKSNGSNEVVKALYDIQSRNEALNNRSQNQQARNDNSVKITPVDRMQSMMPSWMDEGKQLI